MPLTFATRKDILKDEAEVLVCPTNAVGAMGAGLACHFKNQVPGLYDAYRKACKKHNPQEMMHFTYRSNTLGKIIYCLHTKRDWRESSNLKIIESGLNKLRDWCNENSIDSVALPALGCGKGQLEWRDVLPLIEQFANEVLADVIVYPPR
jgi:O-acetyl-ADP-ribose deacetylase (regulator of RNase III)